jgi:hypothetical protein
MNVGHFQTDIPKALTSTLDCGRLLSDENLYSMSYRAVSGIKTHPGIKMYQFKLIPKISHKRIHQRIISNELCLR